MEPSNEIKILILDDRPTDADMMLHEMSKEGFRFAAKHVTTAAEFEAELQNPALGLILSDFKMPAYDGISALMLARRTRPEVPFIMVSGSMGEELAIDSMRLGATDYVLKQRMSRLGPAVTRALRESSLNKNQVKAESLIRRLHEVLRAVRDVDELIVRERNQEKLLAEACNILVRTRSYRVVWIGLVEPDSKRVVPAASAGTAADYPSEITVTWDESKTGRGPVGTAIRRRETCVFQDIARDARFAPWQEKALARGCNSVAAVPMIQGSRVFGSLNVYADRPSAFDREELRLLKELADDLAFALQNIETEQQHQRAVKELRRLATAVEQATETIVITDTEGAILYANPAFERVTGYTCQEALGQNSRVLKSGKHDDTFYRQMWETLARGEVWHGHFINKRKDGAFFEEDASITPVRDAAGKIVNYVAVKRDITAQVALEAQLRQAQKMEAIGTLAGGVAHEINNPIFGIKNYAQLIADDLPPDSRLQKFAAGIMKETDRVAVIVRNLLTFARQDKQERGQTNPNDIIKSVLSLLQTVIRHDQITLTVEVPEGLPSMECRGQQIEQVLMNLLTNARDALNEKYAGYHDDKIIRISAGVFEKDGKPWIRMTVEDHGPGIPANIRNRIFDPFYTTKPAGKGTGLGLSISHGIVKDHGGELHFETEPGRHTRFHVDLPVKGEK
ncbi:MAG: PAS domain S-box protein [Verrucomicrobia bacterium]|nr:PAS domain S-box protein [Verrucomicrobiota bacterium]